MITSTIQSVFNELKNYLLSVRQDLSINPGSVTADMFASIANSENISRLLIQYSQSLQTLPDILSLISNTNFIAAVAPSLNETVDQVSNDISGFIDKFAAGFDIIRNPATYATSVIYFGRFDALTQNITIYQGSQIKTADGKIYTTTATVIMDTTTNYYNPDYNLYLIQVPIIASVSGSAGNTIANSINTLITQISGIQYVINEDDISNGYDEETDQALISRIQTRLSGINIFSPNGMKSLLQSNFPTLKDILIQSSNDSLMIRDEGYGGKTDIYILEESLPITVTNEIHTSVESYFGTYYGDFLQNQPSNPDSTNFAVSNAGGSIPFFYLKDIVSNFSGSIFENSFVYFSASPTYPIYITYSYYNIVSNIQNFLNTSQYALLGSSNGSNNPNNLWIMIKKAKQRNLNITFTAFIKTGYIRANVIIALQTNILNYVSALLLGDSIEQSNVIAIAQDTPGISYLDFTGGIFDLDNTGLNIILTPAISEYIRLGNLVIN
jgi:hypothetical protein